MSYDQHRHECPTYRESIDIFFESHLNDNCQKSIDQIFKTPHVF